MATGEQDPCNWFRSAVPRKYWRAKRVLQFNAKEFHFHSASEHMVDGERVDLELQIFHTNTARYKAFDNGGFKYGGIAILFSVTDYNVDMTWSEKRVMENFFDSLQWLVDDPVTDLIALSDFM